MHRHYGPSDEGHRGHWAAGRHHKRGRFGGGFGFGGRGGFGEGGEDLMRARRMLAQGDCVSWRWL